MDAIGRSAGDIVNAGLGFEDAQRHVQGERITGAAAIAVRRHDRDGHIGECGESLLQASDPGGAEAIVVTDQYLHWRRNNRAGWRLMRARLYWKLAHGSSGRAVGRKSLAATERLARESPSGRRALSAEVACPPHPTTMNRKIGFSARRCGTC